MVRKRHPRAAYGRIVTSRNPQEQQAFDSISAWLIDPGQEVIDAAEAVSTPRETTDQEGAQITYTPEFDRATVVSLTIDDPNATPVTGTVELNFLFNAPVYRQDPNGGAVPEHVGNEPMDTTTTARFSYDLSFTDAGVKVSEVNELDLDDLGFFGGSDGLTDAQRRANDEA